jgi:hypothetical protein
VDFVRASAPTRTVDPLATTGKAGVGHGAARTVVIEIPTQSGEQRRDGERDESYAGHWRRHTGRQHAAADLAVPSTGAKEGGRETPAVSRVRGRPPRSLIDVQLGRSRSERAESREPCLACTASIAQSIHAALLQCEPDLVREFASMAVVKDNVAIAPDAGLVCVGGYVP